MNDLTANVASIIAPYAKERLNAALYTFHPDNDALYMEATFSRCRTEPRGAILMTVFGNYFDYRGEEDKEKTRARAWPFTNREGMIEVLVSSASCLCEEAHVLVFWRGDAFQPPVQLDAPRGLQHARVYDGHYGDILFEVVEFVQSTLKEESAPVAFVLGIHLSKKERTDEQKAGAKIIDKVLGLVGEIQKEEKKEGKGEKRKRE